MERTIISWTPTNWATVFLMALGGFVILKAILLGLRKAGVVQGATNA